MVHTERRYVVCYARGKPAENSVRISIFRLSQNKNTDGGAGPRVPIRYNIREHTQLSPSAVLILFDSQPGG